MAARTAPLDTTVEIVTPENIAFRYRLAGPFRRLPALLVDVLIQVAAGVAVWIGALLVLGVLGLPGVGFAVAMICWFALFWLYGGLFETFWNGQTPGKRLLGIRVITLDGQPVNALQAVLRNVLRIVDAQPVVLFQVGLWAVAMNDRFQRLGDLACGTMVVVEERVRLPGVVRIGAAEAVRLAGLIPPNYQVGRGLGLALAAYVERRTAFSPGRRLEIARHVGEPLRQKFQLPANTDLDMLLCALYYRAFITDGRDEAAPGDSPFQAAQSPFSELPAVPFLQLSDAP
jgi:uncharacterized RDD family membrane protein YckC